MNRSYRFRDLPGIIVTTLAVVSIASTSLFASSPATVPEPVSISLLSIGLAGLVGGKWMQSRRKK
jgi:hypothetical protein